MLHKNVKLSAEELRGLEKFYGFDLAAETHPLMLAGAVRNLKRWAENDGLRVMAVLGQHLEPGEDPVELVQRGLRALGFDVRGE